MRRCAAWNVSFHAAHPENSRALFFFVVSYIHDLTTPVLATALASTMREVVLAAVGALRQLGRRQILVAPAIAAAVPGHFALRYSSHVRICSFS